MSETTSLYRLFDADRRLLYVGISRNPGRRFMEHHADKFWWEDVDEISLERYHTREDALEEERIAIQTERPLYNKTHNKLQVVDDFGSFWDEEVDVHHFCNRGLDLYGNADRATKLWLMPELEYEPYLDEWWPESEMSPFWFWVNVVMQKCPDAYQADAVPIYWTVMPSYETAPFQKLSWQADDFLTSFTWPLDRFGNRIDWFSLEVRHNRFKGFAEDLAWRPSALQPYCPLKSIVESKRGRWSSPPTARAIRLGAA